MPARLRIAFAAIAALFSFTAVHAQEGPYPIHVVVRAESKKEVAPLQASDLKVQFNGHDTPVLRVQPLIGNTSQPVQVAILIDDGLRSNFGNQVEEIRRFAQGIASDHVSIGIAYMQNGRAVFAGSFTSDPDLVAKELRLPLSSGGISASPYFCLQDLIKNWPGNRNAPRVVLMITNGIDPYNGSVRPDNQDSPYVQAAMQDAQRAAVPVYSIYYGRFDVHPGFGSFSGQSYLSQVAEGTGGDLFNQGSLNPPSISPFLKDFERDLRESYLVTFQTGSTKLQQLRVKSTNGAKIRVQQQAGVEAGK